MKYTYPRLFRPHAIPERLHPFSAQDAEDHHEGVEEIREIPPGREISNG